MRGGGGKRKGERGEKELVEGVMMKRGTGMVVGRKERMFLLTSKQID